MVNLLYLKLLAVIIISLFRVVTSPPLIPLIILPFSVIWSSVVLKLNSSPFVRVKETKLNTKVNSIIMYLFFIKFYYRDEIDY